MQGAFKFFPGRRPQSIPNAAHTDHNWAIHVLRSDQFLVIFKDSVTSFQVP